MNNIKNIFKLMNEGNYEEALSILDKNVETKKDDHLSRFYRSFIRFAYLKEENDTIVKDFEILVDKNTPFCGKSLACLCVIYSHLEKFEQAIMVGTDSRCDFEDFSLDYHFALSRSFFFYGPQYAKALEYIDKCIEEEPDEVPDFYYCKLDILQSIEEYDIAEETLEIVYSKFGGSYIYYYLKAKNCVGKYYIENNDTHLKEASSELNRALQYENDSLYAKLLDIEITSLQKKPEDALDKLSKIKDEFTDEEYQIERFKVFKANELNEQIVTEAKIYLEHHESWRVYLYLGSSLYDKIENMEQVKEERDLFLKAYALNPELFIYRSIYRDNVILQNFEENLNLALEYQKNNPNDIDIHYYIARSKYALNHDYDELFKAFTEPGLCNYYDKFSLLSTLTTMCENPSFLRTSLKKYINYNSQEISSFALKRLGFMFLFGENGFPIRPQKAKELIEMSYNANLDEPCCIAAMGRYYEYVGENEKAFEYYQKAFKEREGYFPPLCTCPVAYLAHAYLKGIGTPANPEKSKELILKQVAEDKNTSNNTIIYLYTYFALTNDERFSIKKAKKMLESTYSFERYEITRAMMLKLVLRRLDEPTKDVDKLIKNCLKYGTKNVKAFYRANKNKDLIYICDDNL